ncbi:MAG: BlaI/MecI/CopY family transcriptional regulator [Clostridiales bacterium]|nr:BlaI/MecI/CopY family transcriptional regulator [Clostridiales bacterium]
MDKNRDNMNVELTPVEELLMQCLWEAKADLTVYEMTVCLLEVHGREYSCNAVSTLMAQLMRKGAVSRYKKHHSHQYHPEINMDLYREEKLKGFRRRWYRGSDANMMAALVDIADMNDETKKRMRELLEEKDD